MSTIISKLPTVTRILLGLMFVFSSVTALLGVAPPMKLDGAGALFMGGLAASGYFFPLLKVTELIAGLMLVTNRATPVALVMLAPIVVNIVAFHAFIAPAGLPIAIALLVGEAFLAWSYRDVFAPLFRRATTRVPAVSVREQRAQLRAA
jgi:putative oxidoreductase